jgi:trigger factor
MQEAATVEDDEHVVTADIQQLDASGSPLIGKRNTDVRLYPAGGTLYREIREALHHAVAGETKRVTFETDHEERKIQSHIEIAIKKVEKVNLPEFSDEFVRTLTKDKITTVGEFRIHLRADLESYWEEQSERMLTENLISEIVRRHELTVPESLVKGITASLREEIKNRAPEKKLPADFDEAKFTEENRAYAIFQAKWYLIRERILEAEGLKVEDAELAELAASEAPRLGIDKERLVTFYKSSDAVRERLLTDKLRRFLREHANIREKLVDGTGKQNSNIIS